MDTVKIFGGDIGIEFRLQKYVILELELGKIENDTEDMIMIWSTVIWEHQNVTM